MTPKETFLQEKDLRGYLAGIIGTREFSRCLAYAKAEMMSQDLNSDMLRGANLLEATLRNLCDEPGQAIQFTSGLEHNLGNPQPKAPETTS